MFYFTGRILNRFSKDIGALDELLPRFLLECIQIYLVMFSILALNAAALVWTLLPTTIILLLFYTILQIYLKSAQSIKRLEGTSKYLPKSSTIFVGINNKVMYKISKSLEFILQQEVQYSRTCLLP